MSITSSTSNSSFNGDISKPQICAVEKENYLNFQPSEISSSPLKLDILAACAVKMERMEEEKYFLVNTMEKESEEEVVKRKNKSLLSLCNKFLDIYPLEMTEGTSMDVPLEHLSVTLNLSRRRLYDIINIMESLQMAVKVTKNLYRWYGNRNLQTLLTQLKKQSDEESKLEKAHLVSLSSIREINRSVHSIQPDVSLQPPSTPSDGSLSSDSVFGKSDIDLHVQLILEKDIINPVKKRRYKLDVSPQPKRPQTWKEKSLGGTCLRFIMLFFKHQMVSLDWAGRVLLGGDDESNNDSLIQPGISEDKDRLLRNKVRRVYDVANVLSALHLVRKLTPNRSASRKMLYVYAGPPISISPNESQAKLPTITELPKPVRRSKKPPPATAVYDQELGQRQSVEGLCKRKLDLGEEESSSCNASLQESILENSSSAFSALLAVAEKEFQGLASDNSCEQKNLNNSNHTSTLQSNMLPTNTPMNAAPSVVYPVVEIPSKIPIPVLRQRSESMEHQAEMLVALSNQPVENKMKMELSPKLKNSGNFKKFVPKLDQENNMKSPSSSQLAPANSNSFSPYPSPKSRSALRSLLENNTQKECKPNTVIQRMVLPKPPCTSFDDRSTCSIVSSLEGRTKTVVIRQTKAPNQIPYRGTSLRIPYQLNSVNPVVPGPITCLGINSSGSAMNRTKYLSRIIIPKNTEAWYQQTMQE